MKSICLFISSLILSTFCTAQTTVLDPVALDSFIARGMREWQVPALALVVVKDGRVVTMKGYGVRDLENKEPVDTNTLFMIASNTKLFTATALANLEQQGRLSLDDRLQKYFPDYQLYDRHSTALVTVRDMLCHRIGTETFQGDFTFWNGNLSRSAIMYKMRFLQPVYPFRQQFGYCNSCFMTAGQVVPKVAGMSWEQYVQDSLLLSLEMKRSTTISAEMASLSNVARPYTTSFSEQLQPLPFDQWDNLGPAASIISSVSDLSHWLSFQLDSGRFHGRQLMPFSVLQKTRDMNTVVSSRTSTVLPVHFRGYGLGVFVGDYNGRQVFWHTGGAGGMLSNVCFVPEERLGIAILTTNDNQSFFEALRYQILDAYLHVADTDRSEQFLRYFRKERSEQLDSIAHWKSRLKGNKPRWPLSAFAGTYDHPVYGNIHIAAKDDHLEIDFPGHSNLKGRLQYMDNDEWLLTYNNIAYGIFATRFHMNGSQVASLDIRMNEFIELNPYNFRKIKP